MLIARDCVRTSPGWRITNLWGVVRRYIRVAKDVRDNLTVGSSAVPSYCAVDECNARVFPESLPGASSGSE